MEPTVVVPTRPKRFTEGLAAYAFAQRNIAPGDVAGPIVAVPY